MIVVNVQSPDGSTEALTVDAVESYHSAYRVRPDPDGALVRIDLVGGSGLVLEPDEARQMAASLDYVADLLDPGGRTDHEGP